MVSQIPIWKVTSRLEAKTSFSTFFFLYEVIKNQQAIKNFCLDSVSSVITISSSNKLSRGHAVCLLQLSDFSLALYSWNFP